MDNIIGLANRCHNFLLNAADTVDAAETSIELSIVSRLSPVHPTFIIFDTHHYFCRDLDTLTFESSDT